LKIFFEGAKKIIPKKTWQQAILIVLSLAVPTGAFLYFYYSQSEKSDSPKKHVREVDLTQLATEKLQKILYLTGQVLFIPGKSAHYSARLKGVVTQVHKNVGDSVSQGTPLLTVVSNRGNASFQVVSSLNGQVISRNVNIGEVVTEEKLLFEVADPNALWVELSANLRELPKIKIGQSVQILPFTNFKEAEGIVTYASPMVDEESGRGIVGVDLKSEGLDWPAGLAVNAKIVISEVKVKRTAPKSAIFSSFGRNYVFVKSEDSFITRPVELGREDEKYVEILSGIERKEKFAMDAKEVKNDEI